jgi:hypothetical protein
LSNPRSLIVWGVGIAAVLLPFLAFVLFIGWPGAADSCTTTSPDSCYCEAFVPAVVASDVGGVRQAANTWFNLYAILTSLIVALRVYYDRRVGSGNAMKSSGPVADIYVFAVLFLGLGSMWFHASLKGWAGNFDGLSMYLYAGFLVFYTAVRRWRNMTVFWVGLPLTVVGFTVIGAFWQWELKSLILILVLVVTYLAIEISIWVRDRSFAMGRLLPGFLWVTAVVCIIAATVFWKLSQTGGPLCDPTSLLQPHGLLWHPLAGVMAVLLYFYWREDTAVTV